MGRNVLKIGSTEDIDRYKKLLEEDLGEYWNMSAETLLSRKRDMQKWIYQFNSLSVLRKRAEREMALRDF